MNSKKKIRSEFRQAVYKRDKYTCRGCGISFSEGAAQDHLDAHHITNRDLLPAGGYVVENGITLCKEGRVGHWVSCHYKAENNYPGFTALELYDKINSNYELAYSASEKL